MNKNTCWQGWSCYGLYLKTSEIPILKEGFENDRTLIVKGSQNIYYTKGANNAQRKT